MFYAQLAYLTTKRNVIKGGKRRREAGIKNKTEPIPSLPLGIQQDNLYLAAYRSEVMSLSLGNRFFKFNARQTSQRP